MPCAPGSRLCDVRTPRGAMATVEVETMRSFVRVMSAIFVHGVAIAGLAAWSATDAGSAADTPLGAQPWAVGAAMAQAPTALPPPAPSPRPTEISDAKACPRLALRVPATAIGAAMANPNAVGGYNRLRDENKPPSPLNPRQVYLSLLNPSVPYHPLFNPLAFKAGCP